MILFKDFLPSFHLWLVKTYYSNKTMKWSNCVLLESLYVIPSIETLDFFQVQECFHNINILKITVLKSIFPNDLHSIETSFKISRNMNSQILELIVFKLTDLNVQNIQSMIFIAENAELGSNA